MITTKLISLFIAIWLTIVNIVRLYNKNSLPALNLFCQALAIFVYIVIQFKLYE